MLWSAFAFVSVDFLQTPWMPRMYSTFSTTEHSSTPDWNSVRRADGFYAAHVGVHGINQSINAKIRGLFFKDSTPGTRKVAGSDSRIFRCLSHASSSQVADSFDEPGSSERLTTPVCCCSAYVPAARGVSTRGTGCPKTKGDTKFESHGQDQRKSELTIIIRL